MLSGLHRQASCALPISISKCLAILCWLSTAPTARPISVASRKGSPGPDPGGDTGQIPLGRSQQVVALACPLSREQRIAADDQPLARELLGRLDLGQVPLIEQRKLQRPLLGRQLLDRAVPEAGDPVEAGRPDIFADA